MKSFVIRWLVEVTQALERIEAAQSRLLTQGQAMSAELDTLKSEVAETKTVVDSAVVLLGNLSTLIRNNVEDKPALLRLASDLDTQQRALAEAVAANTPAATP